MKVLVEKVEQKLVAALVLGLDLAVLEVAPAMILTSAIDAIASRTGGILTVPP